MFTDTRCHAACNNRECRHNNGACNAAARFSACSAEQEVLTDLLDVPVGVDEGTLEVATSSADGARTQVVLGLIMSDLMLQRNENTNAMEATFDFNLMTQWQDPRLELSPCALVYADVLATTATSRSDEVVAADTLFGLFWHPALSVFAADRTTQATVAFDRTSFSLDANRSWVAGDGVPDLYPANASHRSCQHCATVVQAGTATVPLIPGWSYYYFPFDQHNVSFVFALSQSNLSSCASLFDPMGLTEDNAAERILPSTYEWNFRFRYADSVVLANPVIDGVTDVTKCQVTLVLKRNGIVFLIKQLLVSVFVVFIGLLALFLHVGDHTGDRTALILVSALIVTTSFQADLGLGPIQYLIWFDYWNLAQIFILVPCLLVALYEHRCFVTDRTEWANTLNKATRFVFPFGYYPVLVVALLVWGVYHDEPPSGPPLAFWLILVFGLIAVTVAFVLKLRYEIDAEFSRRRNVVHMLRTTNTSDIGFVEVLRDAFVAFDTDDSGDISFAELRHLLEIIFPDENRLRFATIMKEVKQFGDHQDNLDEASFIDAVLLAVNTVRGGLPAYTDTGSKRQVKSHSYGSMLFGRSQTVRALMRGGRRADLTNTVAPTNCCSTAEDAKMGQPEQTVSS